MERSVPSFKGQTGGAEGLTVTGNCVVLKDFAVEDAKGKSLKSKGVDGSSVSRVRTEWTGGPMPENGACGVCPLQSTHVMLDGVAAIGAANAGIYV